MDRYTNAQSAQYLCNGFRERNAGIGDLAFDHRDLTVTLEGISDEAQTPARATLDHCASVSLHHGFGVQKARR